LNDHQRWQPEPTTAAPMPGEHNGRSMGPETKKISQSFPEEHQPATPKGIRQKHRWIHRPSPVQATGTASTHQLLTAPPPASPKHGQEQPYLGEDEIEGQKLPQPAVASVTKTAPGAAELHESPDPGSQNARSSSATPHKASPRWGRSSGHLIPQRRRHHQLGCAVGSLILLSTCLWHRSTVPPLSHHHNGSRRGRGPTFWPSAEQGILAPPVSPLSTTVDGRGKVGKRCYAAKSGAELTA